MVSKLGMRALAGAGLSIALISGVLALAAAGSATGQESPSCEVTDLGTLGEAPDSLLEAEGRWTGQDCDSRFRIDADAHTFRFEVTAPGRIRVNLTSDEGDPFVYLLTENGERITDDDDRGAGLDARFEREMEPGVYMVEATTVGGRTRGPADFTVTVSRVAGCGPIHLGTLEPGVDLTASDTWTLDTCGGLGVPDRPAFGYLFTLLEPGRVRIDIESDNGDPVLSLSVPPFTIIDADDDSGGGRNSRLERFLPPNVYHVGSTSYLQRDYQPLEADFTVRIHLVDEEAAQREALLKIEEVHTAAEVVAGDPFDVHYRVGNPGGGNLPDDGSRALLYVVGSRVFERGNSIAGQWQAGVSYHSGQETASAASVSLDEITPFSIEFGGSGPSWVFVAVLTLDADGNEIGFHGQWHNLLVLSGPTFDPVTVQVDGGDYRVSATADSAGEVTTSVNSVADRAAEVDPAIRDKAIYTAGVRLQLLDGIFERPTIAALADTGSPTAVSVADPSSDTLRDAIAERYSTAVSASGAAGALARREAVNPVAIEDLVLDSAEAASAQYAWLADSWRALLKRVDDGRALRFSEALATQSQLAYAEDVISPATKAGAIVTAARSAELGWDDPAVKTMMADEAASCRAGATALRGALEDAGVAKVDALLELDAEMRSIRPVIGLAVDNALCAADAADSENFRFLNRLSIGYSGDLRSLLRPVRLPAPGPAPTHRLRIIARVGDDGGVEHGVQLAGGARTLPSARILPAEAPVGSWRLSSEVELNGAPIGRIRSRRLADGRTEMGFVDASGEVIRLDIAYLPADAPAGVWFRSSEINVPDATLMDEAAG